MGAATTSGPTAVAWHSGAMTALPTVAGARPAASVPTAPTAQRMSRTDERHVELQRWLAGIARIAAAVNAPVSLAELLDLVSRTACELMDYRVCAVTLADTERGVLVIEGSHGLSAEYIAGVNADHPIALRPGDPDQAPSSRAFTTGQAVQLADISVEPTFRPWGGVAADQGFRSMIAVPLLVSGRAFGTLNCYRREVHEFGPDETDLLTTLAAQAAIAIETARLRDREATTIADLRALNRSLAEQHALLQQGEQIHRELTEVALRAGGITSVAVALATLLRRPVLVQDPAGVTLAAGKYAGRSVDAPLQDESAVSGGDSLAEGPTEVPAWPGAALPGPRVTTPVLLGGDLVARIWLPGPLSDLSPLDHRALEHAATISALELLRSRTALEVEWRLSGELVSDLLSGNPTALATITSRAARLGHDLRRPHAVLVVKADPGSPADVQAVLATVRSVSGPVRPRPLVTALADYVVALWPESDEETAAALPSADAVRRAVRVQTGTTASVAVTRPCSSLQDHPAMFRIARGMVELSQLRGTRDVSVTLPDLGIYGLLLQLDDTRELVRYAEGLLRPLREHDAGRGTALLETVAAHLRHGLSTAATAAALYVHPNTVGLRIRRAEELLGLSLSDVESLAQVKVALMADDVLAFSASPAEPGTPP
ncbi:MAG: Two component domain sensor and regulator [Frankiales bacterium]|jgi:DNA-binding PucR family transcriptional regulator|nr:Two component domain sensor and regulator [Frankiales bacterium]